MRRSQFRTTGKRARVAPAKPNRRMTRGAMTADDFAAWRERHELNADQAAEALGLSRRNVYYYEEGRPIPRIVELLCDAIDQGYRGLAEDSKT